MRNLEYPLIKTDFSVQCTQYPFEFVLVGRESKWILYSQKIGVKCAYLRFLMNILCFSSSKP